eukprot:m.255771 g.255771  ORF g.255771 m.255771 type:complete len:570 (+) comp22695_c0_seq12:45-1754(+)
MDTVTAYRKLIAQVQGVLNAHPQRAVKVHWTVPPYKVISSSLAVVRVPWPTDRLSPYATQLLLFLVGLCFILYRILDIAYEEHYRLTPILVVGILVCAFALMNLGFLKREREKRYCEMAERVREITRSLENKLLPALRNTRRLHYTDPVNTAPNPSVDTVSTVRDSIMVGVPANLLVEGDVIFLCPGDKTPAEVRVLDDRVMPTKTFARKFSTPEVPSSGERLPRQRGLLPPNLELARGEVVQLHVQEDVEEPCFVQPHRRHRFKVLQTPLESDLKQMLKQVENRPVSGRIKTRIATTVLLQRIGLVLFLLSLVVNCVRLGVVGDDVGSWVEMVLVLPCTALLPLLPVTLPLVWFSVNLFTAARLEAYFTGGVRTAVSDAGGEGDGDTSSAGSDSTVSTSLSDDRWEDEENEQDELGRRRRWWINAPRSLVLDHFLRMFRVQLQSFPQTFSDFWVHLHLFMGVTRVILNLVYRARPKACRGPATSCTCLRRCLCWRLSTRTAFCLSRRCRRTKCLCFALLKKRRPVTATRPKRRMASLCLCKWTVSPLPVARMTRHRLPDCCGMSTCRP